MIKICTKYGFDILIISGSYSGHRQYIIDDGQWTTLGLWHKLPIHVRETKNSMQGPHKLTELLALVKYGCGHRHRHEKTNGNLCKMYHPNRMLIIETRQHQGLKML